MLHIKIVERDGATSREEIASLSAAVYPPEVLNRVVWRDVQSAPAVCRVVIYDGDTVVATSGVVFRQGTFDGKPTRIGGVCGVMTLPSARGRGFGRAATTACQKMIDRAPKCDFGLLFCEPTNFDFYSRLGWTFFDGTVIAKQSGSNNTYEVLKAMVCPASAEAPRQGIIDLKGLPW